MHHAKVVPGIERTAALLQAATPVQDQRRRSGKSWQGPGSLLRGGEAKFTTPRPSGDTQKAQAQLNGPGFRVDLCCLRAEVISGRHHYSPRIPENITLPHRSDEDRRPGASVGASSAHVNGQGRSRQFSVLGFKEGMRKALSEILSVSPLQPSLVSEPEVSGPHQCPDVVHCRGFGV